MNEAAEVPVLGTERTGEVAGALEVRGLSVSARGRDGARTLVRDVSFTVGPGMSLGIVGESGSGKSLTARALVGLLPRGVSATGLVTFDGRPLLGRPEPELRAVRGGDIALLLQDPFTMLNPLQTVARHVVQSLPRRRRSRAEAASEIHRRLREVGITDPDVALRYPFQLSGGMRQRIAIACALAKDPRLLIADEPTTALDATVQSEVLDLLRRIGADRGMSLILITHDLRVAFSACSRISVMYAGGIIENGPSDALRDRPLHPYSLGLLLADPPLTHLRERLAGIPGGVPEPDEVARACAFAARCDWARPECEESRPPLVETEPSHSTACRRIGDIRADLGDRMRAADRIQPPPVPRPATPFLTVTGLRQTYRRGSMFGRPATVEVLRGVSFEVGVGESVALVGESGSGKTTIARCVLGLATPTAGSIRVDTDEVGDYAALDRAARLRVRRSVQCVFQDPYASLNPAHSLEAMLREAIARRAGRVDPRPEVARLLRLVGLPAGYAGRRPAALSGGERQRAAIARALAVHPKLLICDEAVAALDVSVQAQVLELLRDIRRTTDIGMLFISHDLAVVRQATDRVIVLYRGEIVEEGPTGRVLDRPEHPYTRRLVESARLR
ncbi:dipeptide ABC transporter ATP-binding protein [Streptosporangium sp. NPDC004631]